MGVFDRRTSANIDGVEVYAAPDVAIFHQHRMDLGPTPVPLTTKVVAWSATRAPIDGSLGHEPAGISARWCRYRVVWFAGKAERGRAHCKEFALNELLEQSLGLMNHDVQEMTWLQRWANADPSLDSLPLQHIMNNANRVDTDLVAPVTALLQQKVRKKGTC